MATATPAQLAESGGVSPVELSLLLHRHRPVEIGQCRVCGHDLTISSMGGGHAAKYRCGSPEASVIGQPGGVWGDASNAASEHARRSEVRVSYHGDAGIVAVLTELRRLRTLLGHDMTVPVGERHFPYGHGRHRCTILLVHRGGDVWEQEFDSDFSHDPTHKDMDTTTAEDFPEGS